MLSGSAKASLPFTKVADTVVVFAGVGLVEDGVAIEAGGISEGGVDGWVVYQQELGSTNEPLIVTLTENSGTLTGDKTYQEVKEARLAGRSVDLVMDGYTCSSVLDVNSGESSISVSFIASGQLMTATGAPNDLVSKTL